MNKIKKKTVFNILLLEVLLLLVIYTQNAIISLIVGIILFLIFAISFVKKNNEWMNISGMFLFVLFIFLTRSFWFNGIWKCVLLIVGFIFLIV